MARLPDPVLARRAALPTKPAPVSFVGELVDLRPLVPDDYGMLHAVSNGEPFTLGRRHVDAYDPDERVWRYMSGGPFRDADALGAWLDLQRAAPDGIPLTVRLEGVPVGVANFMANQPAHLKIELGSIWYGPIAQRLGAQREATLMMLHHAFGLGYRRVEWKCDANNAPSRAAALSYGFVFEGIQERHYIVKDRNRDTAWYRMFDDGDYLSACTREIYPRFR